MNRRIAIVVVTLLALVLSSCSGETTARSDAQIRGDIAAKFDAANITDVIPNVQDGVVTLTGTASDQSQIEQALKLANEVEGVTSIVNQIEVGATAGSGETPDPVMTPDAVATARLELALKADAALAGSTIKPSVAGGVATLTGTVGSEEMKTAAEKRAKSVEGVTSVDNQLQITQTAVVETVPDDQIQSKVEQLLDEKFFELTLLSRTKDGTVTLIGALPSRVKMLEVTDAVSKVKGVKAVDTKLLTVQGGEQGGERIGAPSGGN